MSNLVIVEHDNNEVSAATLHAITAAQQIGGDIDLLVAGENCQARVIASDKKIARRICAETLNGPMKSISRQPGP